MNYTVKIKNTNTIEISFSNRNFTWYLWDLGGLAKILLKMEKFLVAMEMNTHKYCLRDGDNGGHNDESYWVLKLEKNNVKLRLCISCKKYDSDIDINFSKDEMIPVIKAIIEKIKELKQNDNDSDSDNSDNDSDDDSDDDNGKAKESSAYQKSDKEKSKVKERNPYQQFIIETLHRCKQNNPGMTNRDCMILAAKEWIDYKKKNGIGKKN